jgi:GST-like protein
MADQYVVYGASYSGSVTVEAALTLIGAPYEVVELPPWDGQAVADEVGRVNPMRQLPALVLPSGELVTESAAILTWLAETHPEANLAPAPGSPDRAAFLRWMAFVSAQIYSLYWVRDDLSRLAADKKAEAVVDARTKARILDCWAKMDRQIDVRGPYIFGDRISVLDLYVAVTSRWRPRRRPFYEAAPILAQVVRRADADPRLQTLWKTRLPRLPNDADDDGVPG